MSDDVFHNYLMETSTAVDAFVKRECAMLARRVIWRAMRIKASGWFGGDYNYKSIWDEYCHLVQHDGGTEEEGWATDILETVIDEIVQGLRRETLHLISLSAAFEIDRYEDGPTAINNALVTGAILQAVSEIAINRVLEHLGPHSDDEW